MFFNLFRCKYNFLNNKKINLIEDEKIISVEFSKYFELNVNQFPGNHPEKYGIKDPYCGYTALALILGYNEFIKSHGYFSYEEENKYIIPAEDTMMINKVPEIIDDFLPEVFGDKLGYSYSDKIKYAAEEFLQNKNVHYYSYNVLWYLGELIWPIRVKDEPVILFGSLPNLNYGEDTDQKCNHAVVVYGYYENTHRLITHYGWEEKTKVIITYPSYFEQGSFYSIINNQSHNCCLSYELDGEYYFAKGCI